MQTAAQFIHTGQVPETSGTVLTIGMRQLPLITFFLALPMLVSQSPVWVSAWFAAADSCAAALVAVTAHRLWGWRAGLASGLIYSLTPAALLAARKIYEPDLVPVLCALSLYGLVHFRMTGRTWSAAVALFAIGAGAELFPLSGVLVLLWLALVLPAWRNVNWSGIALAIVALAVLAAPYIILQLHSGWQDLAVVLRFASSPKTTDLASLRGTLTLAGAGFDGQLIGSLPGDLASMGLAEPGSWLAALGLTVGALAVVFSRDRSGLVAIAALLLAVLATARHSGPLYLHYLLLCLPPAALLLGRAAALISNRLLFAALLLVIAAWRLVQYVEFDQSIAAAPIHANYGVPLRFSLQAAAAAMRGGGPLYDAERSDNHAVVFSYLSGGRYDVRRFDQLHTFVFPQTEATYLVEGQPALLPLLRQVGGQIDTVLTSSGEPAYSLFRVSPSAVTAFNQSTELRSLDVDLAHAVTLQAYSVSDLAAGQPSTFTLEWKVTDPDLVTSSQLRQFAHLVDANGKTWSTNPDFYGFPRLEWQRGDTVVSWFDLQPVPETPSGPYWIETGFYDPSTDQRLATTNPDGSGGGVVRVGPLKVRGTSGTSDDQPALAVFGQDEIALQGVRLGERQVTLTWRAISKPAADYTVFVHVLDAQGHVVDQHDSPPQAGTYPTHLWDASDVVEDTHPLPQTAVGPAHLEIGLYTSTGQRLAAFDGQGHSIGDHLEIEAGS